VSITLIPLLPLQVIHNVLPEKSPQGIKTPDTTRCMNCNREFTSCGFKQHVEKGTTLCQYSHAESLKYSFDDGDEESSQKSSAASPTVDLADPFHLNHHLSEEDPNDDPFLQDNHSTGYPDNMNDDAGSYSSFIPDSSFDINDHGGLSDGEEDELPMFETESVSSCADDYDIYTLILMLLVWNQCLFMHSRTGTRSTLLLVFPSFPCPWAEMQN
jgi:hypothetical protein